MRLILLLIVCGLALCLGEERVTYEGYKVYEMHPKTIQDINFLKSLEDDLNVDYWTITKIPNKPVVAMVEPQNKERFEINLRLSNIKWNVLIEDYSKSLERERIDQRLAPIVDKGRISFTQYHRYSDIVNYQLKIGLDYPELVTLSTIGQSYEGKDLIMLSICKGADGCTKPAIFIECGIHAREWIAPATCLYIIQELVENKANDHLTDALDWFIVPVTNPDGYEFSHSTTRMWRKTRRPGTQTSCYGVDANRNFDFHWMEIGASSSECSETYAGPYEDSESEVRAVEAVILSKKDQIKLYLGFHSYGQYFVHPWGFTTEKPEEDAQLKEAGRRAAAAIASVAGTQYTVGSSIEILYAVSGSSKDWVMGLTDIGLAYTVELPGGGTAGFDLPPSRIDPVVRETFEGVKELHNYIVENLS